MSPDDAATVRDVLALDSTVVPNGVDTRAHPGHAPAEPTALFTGTFGYPPNAEALEWLLSRDLAARARPPRGCAPAVVGRDVPPRLEALAGPSVQVAGWVPEMQPWFDRARAVLVPMRSGGGTRLKVLDGLASGRPLISTTMGAEGIAITAGESALLEDSAEDFADAVLRALGDDDLARRVGAAGRRWPRRSTTGARSATGWKRCWPSSRATARPRCRHSACHAGRRDRAIRRQRVARGAEAVSVGEEQGAPSGPGIAGLTARSATITAVAQGVGRAITLGVVVISTAIVARAVGVDHLRGLGDGPVASPR